MHLCGVDKALTESDFFNAGEFQPLALFNNLHELRRLHQAIGRAGIEPGVAALQGDDVQAPFVEVEPI